MGVREPSGELGRAPRIFALSNVIDDNYQMLRGETVAPCLSSGKRRDLFQCLEHASGRDLSLLSSPPRAEKRKGARWLKALEVRFFTHRQFFCCNWDVPKLRVPLSWIFYAIHILRHVRSGDLVLIDNYEFIYVHAACWLRLFRRVTFILEYEDGKHLICRGSDRVLTGVAEWVGRRLLNGAIVAHPGLAARLPASIPSEVVPGFVTDEFPRHTPKPHGELRFLFSGTLDSARGVDLLLNAIPFLPDNGWHLEITGDGPLAGLVASLANDPRWTERVKFSQFLASADYAQVLEEAQVGLNCQRTSDPISGVTFPSKVFSYLNSGLVVLSSRASSVPELCGDACLYYDGDSPENLAKAMSHVIESFSIKRKSLSFRLIKTQFTVKATAIKLRSLLKRLWLG